jgi:hypothetical protein
MTVTNLLQLVTRSITGCYELVVINRWKTCDVQTISGLLQQLVASLLASSTFYKLITTCFRLVNNREQAVQTHWQAVRFLRAYTCKSLLTISRQQVVFARLVASFQQVWNRLWTTCIILVDIIVLVARLFQQARYCHDITILLQPCVVNLVTFLLYIMTVTVLLEPCNNSDNAINLVTSC